MKCHICGKEMYVVKTEVVQQNDMVKDTIETWRCDDCDALGSVAFRALVNNWQHAVVVILSATFVLLVITAMVMLIRWGT